MYSPIELLKKVSYICMLEYGDIFIFEFLNYKNSLKSHILYLLLITLGLPKRIRDLEIN